MTYLWIRFSILKRLATIPEVQDYTSWVLKQKHMVWVSFFEDWWNFMSQYYNYWMLQACLVRYFPRSLYVNEKSEIERLGTFGRNRHKKIYSLALNVTVTLGSCVCIFQRARQLQLTSYSSYSERMNVYLFTPKTWEPVNLHGILRKVILKVIKI